MDNKLGKSDRTRNLANSFSKSFELCDRPNAQNLRPDNPPSRELLSLGDSDDDEDQESIEKVKPLKHKSSNSIKLERLGGGNENDDLSQSNSQNEVSSSTSSSENELHLIKNFTKLSNEWAGKLKVSWTNARYNLSCATKTSFSDKSLICLFGDFYLPQQNNNSTSNNDNNNKSSKHMVPSSCEDFNKYAGKQQQKQQARRNSDSADTIPLEYQQFSDDFKNIIWFTYRRGFKTLLAAKYDSDCGWGCMLRCGQMMLARALTLHVTNKKMINDIKLMDEDSIRRLIIINFLENTSEMAPFSLHKLVEIGTEEHRREAGDWFAPGATAHILRRSLDDAKGHAHSSDQSESSKSSASFKPTNGGAVGGISTSFPAFLYQNLAIYVANDHVICTVELDELCGDAAAQSGAGPGRTTSRRRHVTSTGGRKRTDSERLSGVLGVEMGQNSAENREDSKKVTWSKALMLIIPLRLGCDRLNQELYVPRLKKLLSLRRCVGLMGGRPKRSLYVVGWHADSAICLDPHYCQDAVDALEAPDSFSVESFSCENPHTMPFNEMDPSCAIGFYLRDRKDLVAFYNDLLDVATFGIGDGACKNPLFSILYSRDELCPRASGAPLAASLSGSGSGSGSRPSSGDSAKSYILI